MASLANPKSERKSSDSEREKARRNILKSPLAGSADRGHSFRVRNDACYSATSTSAARGLKFKHSP
jgi:hypothetical protein